jgi:hypothetical protein
MSRFISPKELDSSQETATKFPGAPYGNAVHDVFPDPQPAAPLRVLNTPFSYPGYNHGLPDPLFKPGVYLGTLKQPDRKLGDKNFVYATMRQSSFSYSWIAPIILTAHKTKKYEGHCKFHRNPRVKFGETEFREDLKDKCQTYEAMRELVERRIRGWYKTHEIYYARTP